MSFWATIKTEIKNLPCLAAACRELGCELITPNAQGELMFNGRKYHGQHAALIKVGDHYCPVHVNKTATGYALSYETDYERQYAEKLGPKLGKLIQHYGINVTLAQARLKGYQAQRVTLPNGSVNVVLSLP